MKPYLRQIYWTSFFMLAACSTKPAANNHYEGGEHPLVDAKYSLSADRSKLDELRKDVPPETKVKNDDEALILQLTQEIKRPPSDVRNTFDAMVRKKREVFDRDASREREQFNKDEKKARDAFLDRQSKTRTQFQANKKTTKEQRDEFYRDQDSERRNFFSDEREKRSDFESQVRERRKNFEDYIRTRSSEFIQEMRVYSRKYDEMKNSGNAKDH